MPRYCFGDFSVDTDTIEIIGPDGVRPVEPQVFDVLRYLIEQQGRLVTKEELLDNVWGDRFVSESALTTRIKQVRRVLDDDGRTQWAIKTVHGRGYRFVAALDQAVPSTPAPTVDDPVVPLAALPDEIRADARRLFVGRTVELGQAVEVLGRASDTKSFGWVWLLGEPGIGKTRLAAEVGREAQRRGHRVLFGRNNEDLRVPYQPFIELIRAAVGEGDDVDRQVQEIVEISPDLGPLLHTGDRPTDPPIDGTGANDATRRYRLLEAIATWLVDAARHQPLTVIIDDVHWAADSTLQLLSHLQNRSDGGAVTFVLTARDTAPDVNTKVLDLLGHAQGAHGTTVLRLDGLADDDARRLVGSTVELEAVMQLTAGNPLLLQAVNPEDGSVDITSAVHRRLASLGSPVQATLQMASIIGLEFDLRVAALATGRDELDVLDDLELAIAARLIDDIGIDRFRFTHALVRSTLREELSSARRARLHRRIADAIAALPRSDRERIPTLAFHTAEAVAADPKLGGLAVDRLRDAARLSTEQLSFDEAATFLARARELVDPDVDDLYARLCLDQGIAETRAATSIAAAATFVEAVEASRSSEDIQLRVEAALRYEDATWRPGMSGAQALEYVDEAIDLLDGAITSGRRVVDDDELRARLAVARLRSFALAGRVADAEAAFPSTMEAARRAGSVDIEAMTLGVYLSHVRFFRGLADTQDQVQRLAELQPSIHDTDVAMHVAHVRVMYSAMRGRFDEASDLAQLFADLQERSHSKFWESVRTNQDAMEALYFGDLSAAEELAEQCLVLSAEVDDTGGPGIYGLRMFLIRREQDRLGSMAPLVRHVLTAGGVDGVWTPGLALLLCEMGDSTAAAEVMADVKAASFDITVDALWSTVMVLLIETMVHLDDRDACAELRDRFAPLEGMTVLTGAGLLCFGSASRYLGMLSFTLGDLDLAESQLGSALEVDDATGSVLWANESRLWLSRVRRAQGHTAEADAMLDVVAAQAGAAGLLRLERLARTDRSR